MTEPARLASAHLEDLAIVAITTPPDAETIALYPELGASERGKLRARLKQLLRYGLPATSKDDPGIRRGYTLRQCLVLSATLCLIDTHLPLGLVVDLVKANEREIVRCGLDAIKRGAVDKEQDDLAVIVTGELWAILDANAYSSSEPMRLRWIKRNALTDAWAEACDLEARGQRVIVDLGFAARTVWGWVAERRLLPGDQVDLLYAALSAEKEGLR
ncbi:hypothetical protein [Stakelama marina]|uniref:Uncharacterized protein n=1 Tax=Stakelama marina TaxID=2826939 RepID=A0A8T4IGR9_9SPHN|nr:hypothetical protein [Stakelama marina]MBR0553760.1 hypothetical protein [Stakelama marina]